MNSFITVYCVPRRSECKEALLCHNALLHKPVILLHDVIEVLNGPVSVTARQVARALQTRDGCWIGGSEIGVDDAWWRSTMANCAAEQPLGGLFVAER